MTFAQDDDPDKRRLSRREAMLGVAATGVATGLPGAKGAAPDIAGIDPQRLPDLSKLTAADNMAAQIVMRSPFPPGLPEIRNVVYTKISGIMHRHGFSSKVLSDFGDPYKRIGPLADLAKSIKHGWVESQDNRYPVSDMSMHDYNMERLIEAMRLVLFIRVCEQQPEVFKAFEEVLKLITTEYDAWEARRAQHSEAHDGDEGVYQTNPFEELRGRYAFMLEEGFSFSALANQAEQVIRDNLAEMEPHVAESDAVKTRVAILLMPRPANTMTVDEALAQTEGQRLAGSLSRNMHDDMKADYRPRKSPYLPLMGVITDVATRELLRASPVELGPLGQITLKDNQEKKGTGSGDKQFSVHKKLRDRIKSRSLAYLAQHPIANVALGGVSRASGNIQPEELLENNQAVRDHLGLPDYVFTDYAGKKPDELTHPLATIKDAVSDAAEQIGSATNAVIEAADKTERAADAIEHGISSAASRISTAIHILSAVAKQLEPVERDPDVPWEDTLKDITPRHETAGEDVKVVYQLPAPTDELEATIVNMRLDEMDGQGVEVIKPQSNEDKITLIVADEELAHAIAGAKHVSPAISGGRTRVTEET